MPGSGSGGGGGYEIPVSVSNARSETINPVFGDTTTFNFASPWASGGNNDLTSRLANSATATSSAALGGNATSQSAPTTTEGVAGNSSPAGSGFNPPGWFWPALLGVGGLLAIGVIIYATRK